MQKKLRAMKIVADNCLQKITDELLEFFLVGCMDWDRQETNKHRCKPKTKNLLTAKRKFIHFVFFLAQKVLWPANFSLRIFWCLEGFRL